MGKKVRCYYNITCKIKGRIKNITVCGLSGLDKFKKTMNTVNDFVIIKFEKFGKRKGDLKRYW